MHRFSHKARVDIINGRLKATKAALSLSRRRVHNVMFKPCFYFWSLTITKPVIKEVVEQPTSTNVCSTLAPEFETRSWSRRNDDTASKSKATLLNSKICCSHHIARKYESKITWNFLISSKAIEIRTLTVDSSPPYDNRWGRAFSCSSLDYTLPQSSSSPLQMTRVPTPSPSLYMLYPLS